MSEIKLVHYRNGVYQGELKANKREGKGILITDEGQIVVGTWKNDKLSGNVLMFLNQSQYSFGEFNRGQLQGWSKFQSSDNILVSQFNASKPINKQILLNNHEQSYKVVSPLPSSIYECLKQQSLPQGYNYQNLQQLAIKEIGTKCPEYVNYKLLEYLTVYYKHNQSYQTQVLVNGYLMFRIKDESSVTSLGFIVNKNGQLVSYGSYVNSKLHGLGCKYENTVRYEGIFQNGFLNGEGLKCVSGKYSYGQFQNGSLSNPIYFEQRSLASQQRLKQLKKLTHLTNLNFANIYLQSNLFRFKGIKQIIFELPLKQQFSISRVMLTSAKKPLNLAGKFVMNRDEPEMKSSVSVISKTRTMRVGNQEDSRVSQVPKSVSIVNSITRFKN